MALWLHYCPWCDWSRDATSPTILSPRCERCGGLLEAVPADAAPAAPALPLRAVGPRIGPAYGRLLRYALIGLMLFAAGRFGWHAGGFGLAVAGVGIVGLFTVPLIVGE